MKKRVLIILAMVLISAGAGRAFWLHDRKADTKALQALHGNVDIRQVSLAFENSGRIVKLAVQEGDRVHSGQVLGFLDTRTLEIQAEQATARFDAQQQLVRQLHAGARPQEIAQAKARLAAVQAQAEQAREDLFRLNGIAADTNGRGVSRQALDQAIGNDRVAQAKVAEQQESLNLLQLGARDEERNAAEAQLRAIEADLDLIRHRIAQCELRAPVDAVVRARLLEPGDMAFPQKAVYTLALANPKWVRVYADETDLGRIKPGMKASVHTDSWPDQPVSGKVGYISSVAEFTPKAVQTEALRTSLVYEVRVMVDDPDNRLRLGQPATVRLDTGDDGVEQ
ncbi:MAG: HlyD family efflux transporter periplasmic adaptor subunit [Desulfatitalea sp.]|nr:efflux RND transporter periplasmic adaptor subunit [Desulfatitalea sp.]NNK02481.1 HlyD family efflux transporter periplasmic adaptor subunit [Desulfatitalea sp.]